MGWADELWHRLNDLLHTPVIDEIAWNAYWLVVLVLTPVITVPPLLALCVYDVLTGRWLPKDVKPEARAILVTGCDTGFGHELAIGLYTKGWKVYAGCYSLEGLRSLNEKTGPTLIALRMDVTNQAHVDAVVKRIEREVPEGLFAVVNNAGIGNAQVTDWSKLQDYRSTMEVNFFGVVAVTKACLPLIKKSKGRVVIVSSMAGLVFGPPCMGAYAASKHAVEAFASALKFEVRGFGVDVVTVNPSFHRTPLVQHIDGPLVKDYENLPADIREQYGLEYLSGCRVLVSELTNASWDAKNVVNALYRATAMTRPPSQLIVGIDSKYRLVPTIMIPVRVCDWLSSIYHSFTLTPACAKKGSGNSGEGRKGESGQ